MLCLSGFELYSRWVPPYNVYNYHTYAYIYRNGLNTKIHSTMLCLSGFELYSRWMPLIQYIIPNGFAATSNFVV